jgi:cytoskeleton protein RodZ
VSDAAAGPGAIVKARREERGLTRQDIADSLNLGQRVIEDIETENWARLPTPAFTRGYLRAYAKLLDIDPDEVASAFEAALGRGEVRRADVSPMQPKRGRGVADVAQKHPGAVLTSAVGVVICAVLVVLWAVWPAAKESAAAPVAATVDPVTPRPLTPTTAPAETASQSDQTNAAATPVAVVATASVPATSGVPPAVSAKPLPAPLASDLPGVRRITATGDDRLKFAFTQDCWVEIKDAQGGIVYSDLSKSGDALELVGHAPFHILLGNAPAVTLVFNDERVALSPHTRNNVGTLVLGQ